MDLKKQILEALGIEKSIKLEYQAKLTDGTIIVSEADELVAGIEISILTEDGTTIPLPPGKYETEDGIGFSVEEEGIVAEIYEEETEEEAPEEEAPEEEEVEANVDQRLPKKVKKTEEVEFDKDVFVSQVENVMNELLEEVRNDVKDLKAELAEMKDLNGKLETEKEELSAQLKEASTGDLVLNKFANAKGSAPVTDEEYRSLDTKGRFLANLNNRR